LTGFDPSLLRRAFPALAREQDGRTVVYLDGPGGTQVPQSVIDAVSDYYRTMNANEGGAFVTSQLSDRMSADAHRAVADLLGAADAEEVKFGANMTTLTFHVGRSIAAALTPGDEIVVTTLDHEANVSTWRAAAADRGLVVRTVDIHTEDGTLDLDDLDTALGPRTKLVAVGYASNALGTINPVASIVERAHAVGAWTYVDAVHYAPHGPIDVQALGTDFLVCSAYKFFGPHLGALYGRSDVLERLPAYKVRPAHDRFETGTPNLEGIAGTLAAVEYLADLGRTFGSPDGADRRSAILAGMNTITEYERGLSARMLDGLESLGLEIWGITDRGRLHERTPTFSVSADRVSPGELAEGLARAGIFAWSGDFYATGLIERLGRADKGGVLRLGLVHYNTADEIDRTIEELRRTLEGSAASG
jgi:cysteine desulfurase family protein (TIGR01976 family)